MGKLKIYLLWPSTFFSVLLVSCNANNSAQPSGSASATPATVTAANPGNSTSSYTYPPTGTNAPTGANTPAGAVAPVVSSGSGSMTVSTPINSDYCVDTLNDGYSFLRVQVCHLVNAQRQVAGLGPLLLDGNITQVSQAYAVEMNTNNFFDHISPISGKSPFDRLQAAGIFFLSAGENIAQGQTDAQSVMDGWMNSSGHRANILSGSFNRIGIGFANYYWVQDFTN